MSQRNSPTTLTMSQRNRPVARSNAVGMEPSNKITKHASKKRRPGRPFKMSRITSQTESSSASQVSSPKSSTTPIMATSLGPPPRVLSKLESLPNEVLENIFLYSLNLNFPRASPYLAAAVTNEHIYGVLITLALSDWTDDNPLHRPQILRSLLPMDCTRILAWEERRALQKSIFRCKWCTVHRVREQFPRLLILKIYRFWIQAGIGMRPVEWAKLEKFLHRETVSQLAFTSSGDDYELHIMPMSGILINHKTWEEAKFHPIVDLSDMEYKLLGRSTGFNTDDIAFLKMLRSVPHIDSESRMHLSEGLLGLRLRFTECVPPFRGTVLHQGVSKAIRTQNLDAVLSLLRIDMFYFHNRTGLGHEDIYMIPSDHFIAVTQYGRENPELNRKIFFALFCASAESMPPKSPEFEQWIQDNLEQISESDGPSDSYENRLKRAQAGALEFASNYNVILPNLKFDTKDHTGVSAQPLYVETVFYRNSNAEMLTEDFDANPAYLSQVSPYDFEDGDTYLKTIGLTSFDNSYWIKRD